MPVAALPTIILIAPVIIRTDKILTVIFITVIFKHVIIADDAMQVVTVAPMPVDHEIHHVVIISV